MRNRVRWVLVVAAAWSSAAAADVCTSNPEYCEGGALVVHICASGTCKESTGKYASTQPDVGETVSHVDAGPAGPLARVPVDPATELPTPPGWSGPNSPPATASMQSNFFSQSGTHHPPQCPSYTFPTKAEIGNAVTTCHQAVIAGVSSCPGSSNVYWHYVGDLAGNGIQYEQRNICTGASSGTLDRTLSTVNACPAGYTNSGGVCNLTDANQVAKPNDSKCGIQRVGNTFSFDPRDNDCTGTVAQAAGLSASGSQVQASSTRQNLKVTANTDGSVDVEVATLNTNGNTDAQRWRVAGSGSITGRLAETYAGTGSLVGTGSGTPQTSSTLNVEVCGLPGKPACKIDETGTPTGSGTYTSATGELDTAANQAKAAIEDIAGAGKKTDFGWVFSWNLPTVSCSPWSITLFSHSRTVEWCDELGRARQIWAWLLGLLCALYVWRRATGSVGAQGVS